MNPLKVFVASSTEGEPVAKELRSLLQAELRAAAVVDLWRDKFAYSETAIESLEKVAQEADFAVLLMTGDDITLSRDKESVAPRDNLTFELGLFIGALGRERTFVAREGKNQMKLPSDILGVTAVTYNSASPGELTASLQAECIRLAVQMTEHGLRPKWLAQGRAALAANRDFCRDAEGTWWEKINYPEGSALSCFTITPDPLTGSLMLDGTAYSQVGEPSALWKSEMVRLYPSERRVAYLWRGTHPLPGASHLRFHGYGTMEFNPPDSPSGRLSEAKGDFWDVDEARPGDTVSKPVEVRRVVDPAHSKVMNSGHARERRELVLEVLDAW